MRDLADPRAENPDDVVISVAANGICGSDLRALTTPPQMIYETGVVIGHEFVGVVTEVGSGVTETEVGQRVTAVPNINCQTCWYCRSGNVNLCENFVHIGSMRNGGAAGYVVVPERLVVPVPDSLSDKMATLVEPLACVLNGTRSAAIHPGETVVVLGGGAIGMLYAMIFGGAGAQVIISEPGEKRAELAKELELGTVVNPLEQDVGEVVRDVTDGRGADISADTVGMLLGDAVSYVRKGGKVLMFGLNDLARADLSISDIVYRELHLHGVYIGKGTFPLAVDLLDQNRIGFDRLLTHSFDLEDSTSAIEAARTGEAVKAVIVPS
ncbi:MAG: alcohol dehydrogenase catalytic domain-containing protein [Solirubrobacterales bacterium]|nr:alcohol dehydrogenase catalytic domain-containing protein [Solirubrobacterales bacterium]